MIARDRACIECEYNLRGLEPAGRCPECGRAIGDSLRTDLLRYTDPAWLGRIILGWRIIYWITVVTVVGGLVCAVMAILLMIVGLSGDESPLLQYMLYALGIAAGLVFIVAIGLYPGACWAVGTPESVTHGKRERGATIVRWTGIVVIPAVFFWFVSKYSMPTGFWGHPVMRESIAHLGLGLLWLHLYGMNRAHRALCARMDSEPRHGQKNAMRRVRRAHDWVHAVPILVLIVHWAVGLGILMSNLPIGALGPLFGLGQGMGAVLITLLWVGIAETSKPVVGAMKVERMLALTRVTSETEQRGATGPS